MQFIPGVDNLRLWFAYVAALGAISTPRIILLGTTAVDAIVDAADSTTVPALAIGEIVFVVIVRVTHRTSHKQK
jgi:hypothetical protein